jgi:hypothetical protein
LDISNECYADALVEEALPQDRSRFRAYLSSRPLGLGLITSPVSLSSHTHDYILAFTDNPNSVRLDLVKQQPFPSSRLL